MRFSEDDNCNTYFRTRFEHIQKRMRIIQKGKTVFADKIYGNFSFFDEVNSIKVLTPYKGLKGKRKFSNKGKKPSKTSSPKLLPKLGSLSNYFSTG
jgi:hypothetical protein